MIIIFMILCVREIETFIYIKIYTCMFIVALSTRAKNCQFSGDPSMGKLLNKQWYIHTMEYYFARKRNKLLITHNLDEP